MTVVNTKLLRTDSLLLFQKNIISSDSLIFTDAADVADFSIELTVGGGWNYNYSNENLKLWKLDKGVHIPGNSSVVVEVKETIRVPSNKYGIFVPTGSMFLKDGVISAAAKVEPNFSGKLKIRLVNTTKKKVKLEAGKKIGSVIFWNTDHVNLSGPIERQSEISEKKRGVVDKIKSVAREDKKYIVTLILSVLAILFSISGNWYVKDFVSKISDNNSNSSVGKK